MNGFTIKLGPSRWRRCAKHALAAGILALSMGVPAWASPLQTRWDNFLSGGTEEWTTTAPPPINARIRRDIAQALASPNPTSNTWVQYLHWRRDLNPARFDHWHPTQGPFIGRLTFPSTPSVAPVIHPQPQTVGLPPHTVGLPPHTVGPPPHTVVPPPVPEPGTVTLALGLIGAGAWWRRPRRRGSA